MAVPPACFVLCIFTLLAPLLFCLCRCFPLCVFFIPTFFSPLLLLDNAALINAIILTEPANPPSRGPPLPRRLPSLRAEQEIIIALGVVAGAMWVETLDSYTVYTRAKQQ